MSTSFETCGDSQDLKLPSPDTLELCLAFIWDISKYFFASDASNAALKC